MAAAVVFAYHNVGVRCLQTLMAGGIEIALVVTHEDNPAENIWFDSVAALARVHGIPVVTPRDPNLRDFADRVVAQKPDFVFSFYYRHMLGPQLLGSARRGALNMHGSLLPKYRGRVPVNWAVINGERETGATLHYMVEKPDAGDIVDQQAVPILPDDTALEVFQKVTVAAEMALHRSLPALVAGTAPRQPQDLSKGSYYGGRRPEDGRIDWNRSADAVHNLVRGVAPPYPGAFTGVGGRNLRIFRTVREIAGRARFPAPTLFVDTGRCLAQCADGNLIRILDAELDGARLDGPGLASVLGATPLDLGNNEKMKRT